MSNRVYIPKHKYTVKIDRLPPEHLKMRYVPNLPRSLPVKVDLRPKMPPVYDQGNLGSCTANALCGAFGYAVPKFMGSRLFLYYNERMLEGTVSQDAGAYLSDGIKCLETYGLCPESEWPYNIGRFTVKPSPKCYKDALLERVAKAGNIRNTLADMKHSLSLGLPFVVGFEVYESFESDEVAKTGIVPMPKPTEQLLGGHAVLVCGYDDGKSMFIVRNSWGTSWGDKGYFYMPYAYLVNSNYTSDLWNITAI